MDPEILKKLDEIGNKIGDIGNRLEKVENFSVKLGQKVVDMQARSPEIPAAPAPLATINNPIKPITLTAEGNTMMPPPPPPAYKLTPAAPKPTEPTMDTAKSSIARSGGFETYFGQWVLGIIGLIAVIFGVSFFLKYAFDNNWIPVTARVLIGLSSGLLFVVIGEFMRKSQAKFADILTATGLGLFYLSTYAAYGYYNLISAGTCFLFMTTVTAFGVILSIFTDSITLASLSTAMGFLVPYLFGLKAAGDLGYFIYTLSLNIGILSVSFFKKWRQLTFLGFIGTILHFSSWYAMYYDPSKQALAIYALTIFYLIYLATNIANKFIMEEKSDRDDLVMLTLNPVWFFSELYLLLQPGHDTALAFTAVGLAAAYILLAYIFKVTRRDDQYFALFLGGISAIFLTIAIPLYFNKEAITIAWAVEAVIIAILGAATSNDGLKKASMGIFAIALVRFFVLDNYESIATWQLILNWKFFTYLVLALTGTILAYLFGHIMGEEYRSDVKVLAVLWTVVNLLVFFGITSEINSYFEKSNYDLNIAIASEIKQLPPPSPLDQSNVLYGSYDSAQRENILHVSERYNSITNQRNAAISVFWTLYAILLISLGILMHNSLLRKSALILFVLTIFKVFILDLSGLETPYRIISFMVLGIILLIVSYLYFKHQKSIDKVTNI